MSRNIIDTIRALLAKAASTEFKEEAEVFLAKAHELMEKHQLESHDLEHDDPLGNERVYRKNNPYGVDWDFTLIFAVARYFGCKAIRMEVDHKYPPTKKHPHGQWNKAYEMDLVGRESARITTIEMHKYLVDTVRRLGREAAKNKTMPLMREDPDDKGFFYETGRYLNADQCARRIGNALIERINTLAWAEEAKRRRETPTAAGKNALITLDAVNALFQRLHPDAEPIKGVAMTTAEGERIANTIGLHWQTGGSTEKTKLLS
jgi:hypothetical protein